MRTDMVRAMQIGGLLVAVALFATACSSSTWKAGPQGLKAGEATCEFRVGFSPDDANSEESVDFERMGDMESASNETCPDVGPCYWRASTNVETGVLTVEVEQPSEGTQTRSWRLDDIPSEGVVLEGPWGGPYDREGSEAPHNDIYRMTCWSGNNR